MKYLINLEYPSEKAHHVAQSIHRLMLQQVGIENFKWYMGTGSMTPNVRIHQWAVECTAPQLTALILMGATIVENLTEKNRASGLKKLTDEEKEALGV